MHIHIYVCQPKGQDSFLLFSEKYVILTTTMFIGSWSFISLSSFMFFSAAVSEIRESNQIKKEKDLQNGLNTFPRHIIDPFFHQSYFLTISHSTVLCI